MKIISYIIGIGVVITGIFGFFGNPFGLLETSMLQNIIYVILGLLLLMAVMKGKSMVAKIVGIIFAIFGILGLVMSGDTIIGLVQNTNSGNWFHLIAGIIVIIIAFMHSKGGSHEHSMHSAGTPQMPENHNDSQM